MKTNNEKWEGTTTDILEMSQAIGKRYWEEEFDKQFPKNMVSQIIRKNS